MSEYAFLVAVGGSWLLHVVGTATEDKSAHGWANWVILLTILLVVAA